MSLQHTADEAGGEAIYCSDALPPLPVPPPPAVPKERHAYNNGGDDDDDDDVIDSSPLPSSHVAMESLGILKRYNDGDGVEYRESRLEKIERIRRELLDLEKNWHVDSKTGLPVTTDESQERELRRQVDQLQEQFHQVLKRNYFSERVAEASSLDLQGNNHDDSAPVVVGQQEVMARADHARQQQQLEQRLFRIEQMIGTSTTENKSLLERLRLAERRLLQIDEKTLTQAASRAKVIRADLEAAAKAKSKLNTSMNGSDSAKISKLYNQLVAMDGFLSSDSQVLNAIVNRLEACADLHTKSMDFGRGLESLETTVVDMKTWLSSLENSMEILEKGMKENMDVIQENMKILDQQFS